MRTLNALLFVIFATVIAACASSGPQRTGAPPSSTGSPDANLWAAAALKSRAVDRNNEQALTQIRKANELNPNRADLTWLHIRLCMDAPGCEPEPLEAKLRKLDPTNGVVWLDVLARAQERGDTRAEQQIVEALSRAERIDLYWTKLVSGLTVALKTASNPKDKDPLTLSLNDVTGWLSSLAVPAFKPVTSVCDPRRATDPPAVERCRRIAQALQRGDTTLVEALGLGIEQRLTTPGTQAAVRLDRRVTNLDYLNEVSAEIIQAQIERDKFSEQVLELMRKVRREQEVSTAILRWAGQPLEPPPAAR